MKIAVVGAGNITNTRHIPALRTIKDAELVGVLSNDFDRAKNTAEKHKIKKYAKINSSKQDGGLNEIDWFDEIEAVVIGAPPHMHYSLVKMFLRAGRHVLVEKPMMMNERECNELIDLAKKNKLIFYVMHNFQYAHRMLQLNEIIKSKKYGDIVSINEVQLTNHDRRLPEWYNDLPMGLFYDEAAHFMYLLDRHAGKIVVENSYAVYDSDVKKQTPITLTVNATAGSTPVTMLLNFHAPVCEWYYIVNFRKRIFIYDFFKDILISLPTDKEHLAGDIAKNSLLYTWQYWSQFVCNGFRLITGKLLYGHDVALRSFILAATGSAPADRYLGASSGKENVRVINDIIAKSNKRR